MLKDRREKIVIIGGGLSGLTLGYFLAQKDINYTILEASPRLGGRIQTVQGVLQTPLEIGATWFSDIHSALLALIEELGLRIYPQYAKGKSLFQTKSFEPPQTFFVPEADTPSYRLAGGTQMLIGSLADKLSQKNIHLNTEVNSISQQEDHLVAEARDGRRFDAKKVVFCIPPQLISSSVRFDPEIPEDISHLLPGVQTWMAGSIKFGLEYTTPFWREEGYSGMLYSHAGIITEMYDHTNFEENKFGFTGFLSGGAASYSQEVRREFVLKQLRELLGEKACEPIAYFDKIWTDEYISGGKQDVHWPHQNNGHPLLQQSYLNGRLFFSGTETATTFPGYMEGAVISAKRVTEKL